MSSFTVNRYFPYRKDILEFQYLVENLDPIPINREPTASDTCCLCIGDFLGYRILSDPQQFFPTHRKIRIHKQYSRYHILSVKQAALHPRLLCHHKQIFLRSTQQSVLKRQVEVVNISCQIFILTHGVQYLQNSDSLHPRFRDHVRTHDYQMSL